MEILWQGFVPPLIAISAMLLWKLAYVGRRPLSPGVKLILVAILIWSCLPMLALIGLYVMAALGGHMGD